MLLSGHILGNVTTVNDFDHEVLVEFTEGEAPAIWFQLVDASRDKDGFKPQGRRYCPPAGSVLTVTIGHIDTAKVITRTASQPYATLDASIFKVQLQTTDALVGTRDIALSLVETSRTLKGAIKSAIRVTPLVRSF